MPIWTSPPHRPLVPPATCLKRSWKTNQKSVHPSLDKAPVWSLQERLFISSVWVGREAHRWSVLWNLGLVFWSETHVGQLMHTNACKCQPARVKATAQMPDISVFLFCLPLFLFTEWLPSLSLSLSLSLFVSHSVPLTYSQVPSLSQPCSFLCCLSFVHTVCDKVCNSIT